ncbi:MAG: cell filamentation protein Fic [Calditrichaeota bacterium]|nr:Fic family protein [Spirochaetales bacterium]RQW04870.1 MAG: cell filamentation protein Fic [Calditrichota bacterium]
MSLKYGTDNDPYCYPGSTTLINKLGIKDSRLLEEAEKEISFLNAREIDYSQPPYNLDYWCSIHKKLFSDIFEWAGRLRTVNITKLETQFCNPLYIQQESERLFSQLSLHNYFEDFDRDELISNSAELYTELNLIHPFREGNGRSQRILFIHLFANCGYDIDWRHISTEDWLHANQAGVEMNYSPMIQILDKCLSY